MDAPKPKVGGARPGAGRKPGYRKPGPVLHNYACRLDPDERALALELGDGNFTKGVRTALQMVAWTGVNQSRRLAALGKDQKRSSGES
jgi:hypothetical protein